MITKTTFKNCIFVVSYLLCLTLRVNAQQIAEPEACKNPPKGYEKGGDFIISSSNLCLIRPYSVSINALLPSGIEDDSEEYLFNFKDGDSLFFSKQKKFTVSQEGTFWVVQKGNITINNTSKVVINCKAIEVIDPKVPDFEYTTCGPNTVHIRIENTLLNQKQSGYRIKWDDDSLLFYQKEKLPFIISYTYPNGYYSSPSIQARYDKDGYAGCFGTPDGFNILNSFRIAQLQSMNDGKEVKLKMEGAKSDKEYYVQYTLNNSTEWVETGVKVIKNSDKTGEAFIAGLRSNSRYCFRIAEKDTCNHSIFSTQQMCTGIYIEPEPPFVTQLEGLNEGKEAKISMIDGLMGQDYVIQYRLKNATDWTDSPAKIRKNADVAEGTVTGLESNKNYCFRTIQRDSVNKTEIVSNEACSIGLKAALLSDRAVKLEWDKIDSDELRRTAIFITEGTFMNSARVSLSDTTFIFDQLNCSSKYKFNLELTFRNSNNDLRKSTVIKSPQILVDPKSIKIPPAMPSISFVSTKGNNNINYNLYIPEPMPKYEIFRSVNGGDMLKIAEVSVNVYNDSDVDTEKNQYCYAFRSINACDMKSELSEKACTIKLSSENYGRLSWTPFIIQADSNLYKGTQVEYTIDLVDATGAVMSIFGSTTDTTIVIDINNLPLDIPNYKFRILARMVGKLNFYSQIIDFPIYSYSNSTALNLILGNENPKNKLSIFPNPTTDEILINSSGVPVRFIELIDMKGQVIHKREILEDTINLSAFEKGKYILRLYDVNNKLLNTKAIVKW